MQLVARRGNPAGGLPYEAAAVADKVCLCTMYDVRSTICGSSRAVWRGVWRSRCGGGIVERRASVIRKRRWRLAVLMYDVRSTIWGSSRAVWRGVWRSRCGGGIEERRASVIRKRRWRLAAPMYDVRFSMYDVENSRACARVWRSRCGGGIEERRAGVVRKRRWRPEVSMCVGANF